MDVFVFPVSNRWGWYYRCASIQGCRLVPNLGPPVEDGLLVHAQMFAEGALMGMAFRVHVLLG